MNLFLDRGGHRLGGPKDPPSQPEIFESWALGVSFSL